MSVDNLAALDAVGHIELVRSRAASPREVIAAAAERLERVNGTINAVVTNTIDQAREEATDPARPPDRYTVPMLLKDFSAQQIGVPYCAGNALLRKVGWRSTFDSFLVERLRTHGFISLGRTNTPEFAMSPVTEPTEFGATRNPWDVTRSAGGSSGGSAAAVAAGIVPVAHGNDGGGSLRMPASACGVVGLKPTRGRISMGPHPAERAALAVMEGFVTRTIRDAALMLDVASGRADGDLAHAPRPVNGFGSLLDKPPPTLRIRLVVQAFNDVDVDPECAAAAHRAAEALEGLGHAVELWESTPINSPPLASHAAVRGAVMAAATLAKWEKVLGRPLGEDDVEPATWQSAQIGRTVRADEYAHAVTDAWRLAGEIHEWWTDFDVLVTPTTARVADHIGGPTASLRELGERGAPWRAFTPPFNLTGQPAISLPVAMSHEALPIGVQLVAATGREDQLLTAGRALELCLPWKDRRPAVWAGTN